jgi:hypothetical protein
VLNNAPESPSRARNDRAISDRNNGTPAPVTALVHIKP